MRRSPLQTTSLPNRTPALGKRRASAIAVICTGLFVTGLAMGVLVSGGCGSNDENQPQVITQTVNGTVKIITTGP
jgi:hypothetical protein